ncbi:MAG: methyl-accepting chemotaxis protein [Myxococcota bacterium]
MLKTPLSRAVAMFALLDVLFNPLVMIAFVQLLGVQNGGIGISLLFIGLLALKVLVWAPFLHLQLAPYQWLARRSQTEPHADRLRQGDAALQKAPANFSIVYAISWSITYGLAYLGLRWLVPEELSPRALESVLLVVVAVFFGGFAFAFPLMTLLTGDAAGECSILARKHDIALDRPPISLSVRTGVIALALGLGPTLWMTALGYMKQVESARQQRGLRAEIAALELAKAPRDSAGASTPTMKYDERSARLIVDDQGRTIETLPGDRSLNLDEDARDWLRQRSPRANKDVLSPANSSVSVAFARMADSRLAVVVLASPVQATSSFAFSAGAFALVVGIWAPLCAVALGRAVSTPIERLTNAARQVVEEGKQSQIGSVPSARNDEIGVLTDRFNDLLDLMRDLSQAADAIARGDLRIVITGKGDLPDAFRGMLDSLRRMVRQISETSVELGSAATEIFAATQEQEAAATSQSSAMEEISRTMDSLSESAAHVSDAVQGVLSNAERTLQNTDGMVKRIGDLSALAGRIGEILDVIREIADRSDLLALNGSLEASRAGEGGHGFALVAGEMRRLAERVTASVQDVKKLVSDIRDSGSSTVMATEESKRLAEGTTEAARQITFVTQQQRSGTEQVSQSIKNIVEITGQAVSATSQTRTSAEGLKLRADRLAELVRRFETVAVAEHA